MLVFDLLCSVQLSCLQGVLASMCWWRIENRFNTSSPKPKPKSQRVFYLSKGRLGLNLPAVNELELVVNLHSVSL